MALSDTEIVRMYNSEMAKHLEDIFCAKVHCPILFKRLTSSVGEMFDEHWRVGESEILADSPDALSDLITEVVDEIRTRNLNMADKEGDARGILKTDISILNQIIDIFTHVFLTGEEVEHFNMIEEVKNSTSEEDALSTVRSIILRSGLSPPPVPVINVDMFFGPLCHVVSLIVSRDIVNEAFNGGTEGEDREERDAFERLRSVLYSISESHRCSCGAREKSDEAVYDMSEDNAWVASISTPPGCKCDRGGGFNVSVLCSAIVDHLGDGDCENSPIGMSTIADEIFFCEIASECFETESEGSSE